MRFSSPWVFSRRSSFAVLSCFLACTATLVTGLAAQTAHFSYALSLVGSGYGTPTALAIDQTSGLMYVANHSLDMVSVVDPTANTVVATVPVGAMPNAIAISSAGPSAGNVYVANEASNTVSVIDHTTNTVIATVLVGGQPVAIAVSSTGPEAGDIYVANSATNTVSIIDPVTNTVINTVPVGITPSAIAVSSAGPAAGSIYVANETSNTVSVINPATNTVIATVLVATSPDAIAVSPTGPEAGYIYVASQSIRTVAVIDPSTNTTITVVPVAIDPDALAVSGAGPGAGNIYVANGGSNSVSIISPLTNSVTSTIAAGSGPDGIAIDNSGNVYIANGGDNSVVELGTAGVNFNTVAVNSNSAAQTLAFTFDTGGTIGTEVLTLGAPDLDFTDAGTGTCTTNGPSHTYSAGENCTMNVRFAPKYPGLRRGAAVLYSGIGPIASANVYGTGAAPQIIFSGGNQQITIRSGVNFPRGVAEDGNGNIFITESGGGLVTKYLASTGYTTTQTVNSSFNNPWGIAVDSSGNIFVGDSANNAVKELLASSGYTTAVTLGSGFNNPMGVAVDIAGNVFVADTYNGAVKEILASGGYTTVVTLATATFAGPSGVAVDASGNVFVADTFNNAIKEILASSGYTTVQTLPVTTTTPYGVEVDGAGNLFVADTGGSTLQELYAATDYTTSRVLATGLVAPFDVTVDPNGNVFFVANDGALHELDFSDGPTLNFAPAVVGSSSPDSPQTVTLWNNGNETLTFPLPGSGTNPSISPNFSWDNTSTCVQTNSGSASAFTLAAGASCTASIDFAPIASGAISSSEVLTDNSLNDPSVTQSISLNGNATAPAAKLVYTVPPAVQLVVGENGGATITVEEQTADGDVVTSAADLITLTVTGPHSYSQTYTATAASGVATFDVSGTALTDGGTYTYTASFGALTNAVATETVIAISYSDPETVVGNASSTQTATVFLGSNFTLGSVAVLTQGVPNLDFQAAAGGSCTVGTPYTTGQTCTVSYTFQPVRPGTRYGAIVLYDNANPANAVATVFLQGTGDAPQVIFSGNPKIALGTGFNNPGGVAIDAGGNIFVADYLNDAVKEIVAAGGYTTVNTLGNGFSLPTGVAVDGAGNVFVTDWGHNAVKEIVAATGYTTVNTLGSFNSPAGLAVDGSGNVFVTDAYDGLITEIVAAGGYTTSKTVRSGLDYPFSLALDGGGNIFIADFNAFDAYQGDRVIEIFAAGGYTTMQTLGGGFHRPAGIALDAVGNVFVADFGNGAVKEILASGGYTTVNTLGSGFNTPIGVALDGSGDVYVVDRSNSTVSELDFSNPPSLSFATTPAGLLSSDSPQTVTVSNDGNTDLVFADLTYPADFPEAAGVATDCTRASGGLSAGDSCTFSINFLPLASSLTGPSTPLSETVVLTDNSLSASSAVHSVAVSGTATPYTAPSFSAPTGGTLAGSTDTFSWNPGNATNFEFRIGTVLGANDVFSSHATTLTSFNVTTLPTKGLTLYGRLYYMMGGTWHAIDTTWIEAGTPVPPTLLSPAPGSTLTGDSVNFAWDPGTETKFKLTLGNFQGGNGLYGSGPINKTSVFVTNLPITGTIHARLYYLVNGTWNSIDYVFYTPTYMSSPAPSSTLSGSTATFNWAAGSATAFKLQLGHFQGGFGIYGSGIIHSTSATVSNLPTDGKPVYARLSYLVNGVWQFTDYVYTAQ